MKCPQCGAKNEPNSKFCRECGASLTASKAPTITAVSELYGKEVDVLFFLENYTGKIAGIVNPSPDQLGRYREAVLQRVVVENPGTMETDENIGALLTFIRQSKEYLGEKYDDSIFRNASVKELKKEYLKLFEKILKNKSRNPGEAPKPPAPGTSAPDGKKISPPMIG